MKRSGNKRPKVTITFSDESVFEFSEDVFISTRFNVGDSVDNDQFENIIRKQQVYESTYAALSLINYRFRSGAELFTRLKQKGFQLDVIEQTLDYLEEKKFLNDALFAENFIHDRIHSRLLGPIAIKQELVKHNIKTELAEQIIKTVYDSFSEEEIIERLLGKKKIRPDMELSQKSLINIQ